MKIGVFLHLYYLDLWPEMMAYIKNIPVECELLVNFPDTLSPESIAPIEESIKSNFDSYKILFSENKGLDVGGYINIINYAIEQKKDYDLVVFLHTKKHARTDPDLGKQWRKDLFKAILGSEYKTGGILDTFQKNDMVGMIGCSDYVMYMEEDKKNIDNLEYFSKRLGIDEEDMIIKFVAGSIFWSRWWPFRDVFSRSKIETSEFEESENYTNDGMKAHAIERMFGIIIIDQDLEIMGVELETEGTEPEDTSESNIWYQQQNKFLEKYIELKCDIKINNNIQPAVNLQDKINNDIFYLFDVILERQFGAKRKRDIFLKDLCLIKTTSNLRFLSEETKADFQDSHLFPEYTKYSQIFQDGEKPSPVYLIHPSVLEFLSDIRVNKNLYQLDGMRRVMSALHVGIGEMDTYVVVRREHLKNIMATFTKRQVNESRSKSTWFPEHQEIIEFNLKGEITYAPKYTEVYDFSILKDKVVVDFGGNVGQAALEAYFCGAKEIYNFDCQPPVIESAKIIAETLGASNLNNHIIDFNKLSFKQDVLDIVNNWDWAIFQAIYRTKEIKDIQTNFDFIVENTKEGIFFEGHADPKIDTDEFYRNIFEKYDFKEIEYLGHSNGRPAYSLLKKEEWEDWGKEEFVTQLEELADFSEL